MNKHHIVKYLCCLVLLCILSVNARATMWKDSSDGFNKAIAEAVAERIQHGGSHIISMHFDEVTKNHFLKKFRLSEDEKIWNMGRLAYADGMLQEFQETVGDDTEVYLAVIAIYNYAKIQDKEGPAFDYQYFKDHKTQDAGVGKGIDFLKKDIEVRNYNTTTLMKEVVGENEGKDPTLKDMAKRKVMVYSIVTYFIPPTGLQQEKGVLVHQQGLLYTAGIDKQRREDIIEHLSNFRGGLNGTTAEKATKLPNKEEQILKSLENICLIYKYGPGDGTDYDNNSIVREVDYNKSIIDGTALTKRQGRVSPRVKDALAKYLDRVNNGAGDMKVDMLFLDENAPKNEEITQKAEGKAKKDKALLMEVEVDKKGGVIKFKLFNGSGYGGSLCEETKLREQLIEFCDKFGYEKDDEKRSILEEPDLALFVAYRGVFNYLQCATEETYIRIHYNNSGVYLAAAGFVHTSMDMLDILSMVTFIRDAVVWAGRSTKSIGELMVENTIWMLNIRQQFENAKEFATEYAKTNTLTYQAITKLLPPIVKAVLPDATTFTNVGNVFHKLVDGAKENWDNPYIYGQATAIIVFSWTGAAELVTLVKTLSKGNIILKASAAAEKVMMKLENLVQDGKEIVANTAEGVKRLVRTESGKWVLVEELEGLKNFEALWAKLGNAAKKLKEIGYYIEEEGVLKLFKSSAKQEMIAEVTAEKVFVEIAEMTEGSAIATTGEMKLAFRSNGEVLLEEAGALSIREEGGIYSVCRNGACFTGATEVFTNKGRQAISTLERGDSVLAWNETTGKQGMNKVKGIIRKTTNKLLQLAFSSSILLATPEHPFYVDGLWKQAADLHQGDVVVTANGGTDTLRSVVVKDTVSMVYNLDVEHAHTYYVGSGILVHNACALVELQQKLGKDFKSLFNWSKRTGLNMDEWMAFCNNLNATGHSADEIRELVQYLGKINKTEFSKLVSVLGKEDLSIIVRGLKTYPNALDNLRNVNKSLDEVKLFLKYMDKDIHPKFAGIVEGMSSHEFDAYMDRLNRLLDKDLKFKDGDIQKRYDAYLKAKRGQKKPPRSPSEWLEASEYMQDLGPTARGNKFNQKARENIWDAYVEIRVEGGKYVDGYTPPIAGKEGRIVSRKAIDLDDYGLDDFEAHLIEMETKYKPGTKITSVKEKADFPDNVLEGQMYLEIPDTNRSFPGIKAFEDLAWNKYKIKISYRPE
ncbi:intein/intein [Chitinophaga dinghuensis]|uniref:Intein/intein n=1 Tax=Chitinophaga dinghuensis TaxID=1539050 RepID=A0A327WBQ6_9BACT|nr:polymorphic toxin-type HINT domain-containing protein [Chitinophaga dinghuensis]RAJ87608.1 intein/intein [Chitinophaga dinghuensis]